MLTHHILDCLAVVAPLRDVAGALPDAGARRRQRRRPARAGAGRHRAGPRGHVRRQRRQEGGVHSEQAALARSATTLRAVHSRVETLDTPRSVRRHRRGRSHRSPTSSVPPGRPLADGGTWLAMKAKRPTPRWRQLTAVTFHVEPSRARSWRLNVAWSGLIRKPALASMRCLAGATAVEEYSASPIRKAASARRPPPSTSPPAWPSSASASWSSTSTRKATRRWARASTSARSTLSVYDVLLESATIAEARQASPSGGYDVLGANRELAGAEIELVASSAATSGCAPRSRPSTATTTSS